MGEPKDAGDLTAGNSCRAEGPGSEGPRASYRLRRLPVESVDFARANFNPQQSPPTFKRQALLFHGS
jgi:hypothetical protein